MVPSWNPPLRKNKLELCVLFWLDSDNLMITRQGKMKLPPNLTVRQHLCGSLKHDRQFWVLFMHPHIYVTHF